MAASNAGARGALRGVASGGRAYTRIQAFDFTVSGPLGLLRVAVNPASALAPGVLLDIVRRLGGGGSPRSAGLSVA